jgi:hypothetical protein
MVAPGGDEQRRREGRAEAIVDELARVREGLAQGVGLADQVHAEQSFPSHAQGQLHHFPVNP